MGVHRSGLERDVALTRNLHHLRALADVPYEMRAAAGAHDVAHMAIDPAAEEGRDVENPARLVQRDSKTPGLPFHPDWRCSAITVV